MFLEGVVTKLKTMEVITLSTRSIKAKILPVIFVLLLANTVSAQFTNIMISDQFSPSEVSIMMDPNNTDRLVAGSNLRSFYYSTNGGLNWTRGGLTSSYNVWGDPCIIVDTLGHFYYFHLSNPTTGSWIDRIVCQKSTDGGMTWSDGTYFGLRTPAKAEDKEWAVVDRTNNNIYVSWTEFDDYGSSSPADSSRIWFVRSTDAGATWTSERRLDKLGGDCVDEGNTVEGAVPTVGPNGEVYSAWSGPLVRNTTYGIFFNKSTDAGATWLSGPIYVGDQPGGWAYTISGLTRCNGLPVTVCDISAGPHRGNIYINFSDQRNGVTDTDVWIYKSTDGGTTWSNAIRVNDDAPGKQQFMSWMTVDQVTGYVYVVFYDRRAYTNTQTDIYIAKSTDGGNTFQNTKISSTPFIPVTGFFGDYSNITAHNNIVRPIWTRLDGSNLSIWTAIIDYTTSISQVGNELPEGFSLKQNYPNPFNPSTTIEFSIPLSAGVKLRIFDVSGREIASPVNENLNVGSYRYTFDADNLSSGIYFYELSATGEAGNYKETKRMVLLK